MIWPKLFERYYYTVIAKQIIFIIYKENTKNKLLQFLFYIILLFLISNIVDYFVFNFISKYMISTSKMIIVLLYLVVLLYSFFYLIRFNSKKWIVLQLLCIHYVLIFYNNNLLLFILNIFLVFKFKCYNIFLVMTSLICYNY